MLAGRHLVRLHATFSARTHFACEEIEDAGLRICMEGGRGRENNLGRARHEVTPNRIRSSVVSCHRVRACDSCRCANLSVSPVRSLSGVIRPHSHYPLSRSSSGTGGAALQSTHTPLCRAAHLKILCCSFKANID